MDKNTILRRAISALTVGGAWTGKYIADLPDGRGETAIDPKRALAFINHTIEEFQKEMESPS